MRVDGKSTRYHERTQLQIPVEVSYLETADDAWKETTVIEEITICGGGFIVSHPVEPKRLIHLRLPMPKKLRLYDFAKDRYDVWAVVRYVRMIRTNAAKQILVKVGAAFIGSQPPPSFRRDPTTLYDLKPVLRNESLWDWRESPRNSGRYARWAEQRDELAINVIIEVINERGQIIESAIALTQNVSENGMAVIAKIASPNPKYVLVKTPDKTISLLAKVRGVHPLNDLNARRIHLEFISGKWLV